MTITKPTQKAGSADAFISGAPDAQKGTGRGIRKGKKEQIAVVIQPELLDRLDAVAAEMGQSRSALIGLAIYQALQSGFQINGGR